MKYDERLFDPPAPLAFVTLRDPKTSSSQRDVPMLIDSGADVTLVPQQVIASLHIESNAENIRQLMSFDGSVSAAPVVRLELLFQERTFRGQFLITQDEVGVLGRNILNKIPLVLHGPHQEWYELKNEP